MEAVQVVSTKITVDQIDQEAIKFNFSEIIPPTDEHCAMEDAEVWGLSYNHFPRDGGYGYGKSNTHQKQADLMEQPKIKPNQEPPEYINFPSYFAPLAKGKYEIFNQRE